MFNVTKPALAGMPSYLRYAYFIVSGFRFTSFHAWRAKGEPNPFVKKTYRHHGTMRVDYIDVFSELDRR